MGRSFALAQPTSLHAARRTEAAPAPAPLMLFYLARGRPWVTHVAALIMLSLLELNLMVRGNSHAALSSLPLRSQCGCPTCQTFSQALAPPRSQTHKHANARAHYTHAHTQCAHTHTHTLTHRHTHTHTHTRHTHRQTHTHLLTCARMPSSCCTSPLLLWPGCAWEPVPQPPHICLCLQQ